MFFGTKKVIGLDIGTSSLKAVEVDVSAGLIQLQSFAFLPTPPQLFTGAEVSDAKGLSLAIKTLLHETKSKRKNISLGVWGSSVIVKKVTIPKVEKKMIKEQVKWEAEQYIPFDLSNVVYTYNLIEGSQSLDSMDILLVAAQNDFVNLHFSMIQDAGYNLGVMDLNCFALANIFEMNYGKQRGQNICLLNIGAATTNMVVLQNGSVIFSRDIPVGGANYTNEISKELGITPQEAESLKLTAVSKGEVPQEVNGAMVNVNDMVITEINNSYEFFMASNNGLVINKCYYTGGASQSPGLIPGLTKMINVSFEEMNPFNRVRFSNHVPSGQLGKMKSFLSIALGLSIRTLGDS